MQLVRRLLALLVIVALATAVLLLVSTLVDIGIGTVERLASIVARIKGEEALSTVAALDVVVVLVVVVFCLLGPATGSLLKWFLVVAGKFWQWVADRPLPFADQQVLAKMDGLDRNPPYRWLAVAGAYGLISSAIVILNDVAA